MATLLHKTIPQSRYFSTTTVISADDGASSSANLRELIGRVFSTNVLLPYGKVVEFTSEKAVREYFGLESDGSDVAETAFAQKYFGIVGNDGYSPTKLSFCRWNSEQTAASLTSVKCHKNLTEFIYCENLDVVFNYQLSDGVETHTDTVGFKVDQLSSVIPGDNTYSVVNMLNDGFSATYGVLKGCSASYEDGRLKITFPEEIRYVYPCSKIVRYDSSGSELTSIGELLGFSADDGVVCSDYAEGETESEAVTRSCNISNNFASFCFLDGDADNSALVTGGKTIMPWMLTHQYGYLYVQHIFISDTGSGLDGVNSFLENIASRKGMHLVVSNEDNGYGYEEAIPMGILASTRYDDGLGNANWMFVSCPDMTASVDNAGIASSLDALNVNYLGITQTIALTRNLYQRGHNLDGELASVYSSELWLRDRIGHAVIHGLIDNERVDANDTATVSFWIGSVIQDALANGTIEVPEEDIDDARKLKINDYFGGVKNAWKEIQKDGYGLQVGSSKVTNGRKVSYRLAYYSHSQIFKLEGTHYIQGA